MTNAHSAGLAAVSTATPALPRRLLTIADSARALSVSERHLREQILRGRVQAVRIGKCVRLTIDTVEQIARDGIPIVEEKPAP